MKRVAAILDLPPRRSIASVRESVEAAALRWNAEVHWMRRSLQPCHPFWQKMFVCGDVAKRFGSAHVLQLDNDMLIRSDCPSPFDLASPDKTSRNTASESQERTVFRNFREFRIGCDQRCHGPG